MKPFRFGVQVHTAPSPSGWRSMARRIEELGYSSLLIPDHFGDQYGPLVALAVAAEATSTLRVGSLVFGNDYRHPVVLAKEIATLELLSNGRVEFGLGAGWMSSDYDEAGMTYAAPGERVSRMAESLIILKQLWGDGTSSFQGDHYTTEKAQGLPRLTKNPQIVIGGGSPRVLGIAAREADIVGVNPNLAAGRIGREVIESTQAEYFDERIGWIREAAGSRFDSIELQILTNIVQITDDRDTAISGLASLMGVTVEQVAHTPIALIGSVDQIVETLIERRERYGFSYIVVHEPEIESFAPVVAALNGL